MNSAKRTLEMAHKTWLVTVGVYDSGREKTVDKIDQLFVDGSQLFNDLLEKGESIEVKIQANLEVKKMLRDKISALRAKFGLGNENRDQKIDILNQRVDNLIEVVAKLAQQKAAEQQTTAPATKKTPAKTAAKAIATKAPAKTVAKTTTTKAAANTAAKAASKATTSKATAKPTTKARATKAPAKTVAKPVAKTRATKAPAKTAAKPAAKTTTTKAAPAEKPKSETNDAPKDQ